MRRGVVLGSYTRGPWRAAVTFFSGRWAESGQLPEGEIESGRLGPYSAADATQGGTAMRASASLAFTTRDLRGRVWHLGGYVVRSRHRFFVNPTLFADDTDAGDQKSSKSTIAPPTASTAGTSAATSGSACRRAPTTPARRCARRAPPPRRRLFPRREPVHQHRGAHPRRRRVRRGALHARRARRAVAGPAARPADVGRRGPRSAETGPARARYGERGARADCRSSASTSR